VIRTVRNLIQLKINNNLLFSFALIPLALSHQIYSSETLNLIESWQDPLEGGSARRKTATYTGHHKQRKTDRVGEGVSCLRPRGHCDGQKKQKTTNILTLCSTDGTRVFLAEGGTEEAPGTVDEFKEIFPTKFAAFLPAM
jgi:hypothetical protein